MNNVDLDGFLWEPELLLVEFLSRGDGLHLAGHHGQHFEVNTVELVEAAPQARLAKSFENLGHVFGSVLISAIGHHHKYTQGTAQIFYSFGLTSSSGSSRGASIKHAQGLRQGNITTISQGRDA